MERIAVKNPYLHLGENDVEFKKFHFGEPPADNLKCIAIQQTAADVSYPDRISNIENMFELIILELGKLNPSRNS